MARGRLCALALLFAIAAPVAGCGGGGSSARPIAGGVLGAGVRGGSSATPSELAWLHRLGAWNARLAAGLQRAGALESSPRTARLLLARDDAVLARTQQALAPATSCASDLRAVGPAPTARLREALGVFRRSCAYLERVGALTRQAVAAGDDRLVARANTSVQRGTELLSRANDLVPPGEARPLPVIAGPSGESRVEPVFGTVASELAGKPVEVRCWSGRDWQRLLREERAYGGEMGGETLGFAAVLGTRANLHPDVCHNLEDLTARRAYPADPGDVLAMAASLVTLAHESQHLKGIASEAVAECYGMQLARDAAAALGVEGDYTDRMLRAYSARYDAELPAYRTAECRDGGALDLHPETGVWP